MLVLWQVVLAMGATGGFAVLFNALPRVLPICAAIGGAGFYVRALLGGAGVSVDLATLLGAAAVALLGTWGARRYRVPALLFNVTGFIPFLPGVLAYETVLRLLDGDYVSGLSSGVQAAIQASAIAGGIGTVTALVRLRDDATWRKH